MRRIRQHLTYAKPMATVGSSIALGVALLALSLPARASAGTIRVTTTFDQVDGAAPCSLREAVNTANADANSGGCTDANPATADTIRLAGGDYNLQRAGYEDANASGDLDVTESLTIAGAGADLTGIDGNGASNLDRVLQVTAGTLTITGLTVRDGGAVVPGPCVAAGGGIFGAPGTALKLTDSTVSGNRACRDGGAIYADTATLTRSTVSGNEAFSGSEAFAGGPAHVGGIYANTVNLTNSTVSGNQAVGFFDSHGGTDGQVGGIYAVDTATLTNSTVRGNEANYAVGGILTGTATLTNSAVSDNKADDGEAGGIAATTATLTNSTVRGNTAAGRGGGIYGAATLTDSSVRRNEAGAEGGGIYADTGSLAVTRSTISDNDATNNGGGIFFTSPGTLNVTNSTLSGNESNGWGGALSTDEGTTNLKSATINRNVADADLAGSAGSGGGLDAFGTAAVNLKNTILAGNLDRSPGPEYPDWNCSGSANVVSQGYNLLSSTANCAVTPATGDATAADPGLDFLTSNGGKTLTQKPLSSSPAVNTGHPAAPGSAGACPSTDQRGVPRSLGGRCDKGAYERVSCRGVLVNLVGTGGASNLSGTSAADGVLGLGGNDTLSGGSGNDGLCGGEGNDKLSGGTGNDHLDGGPGADNCDGGPGTDTAAGCETTKNVP